MSYKFDSIVSKNEAAALKDMIFKRAQERAKSFNDDAQADVMDMARDSFVSKDNPFSKIIENTKPENTTTKEEITKTTQKDDGIGFPMPKEVKLQQNNVINNQITSSAINNNMREAREALTNKKSFMGALNFLNSQAAVSLMRTRADKFEIVV